MLRKYRLPLFCVLIVMGLSAQGFAAITLPAIIGDHMVLQAEKELPIWGWATPGSDINVDFKGKHYASKTDEEGRWEVTLAAQAASQEGGSMTISGDDSTITLADILIGEVWVASGQSNMDFQVQRADNAEKEIAAAQYPGMRLFKVGRKTADAPQQDCAGSWQVCSPETVAEFSAVGYYFGRELHQNLKAPVGLIHTAWGGTPVEAWTSQESLNKEPAALPTLERWKGILADYPEKHKEYLENLAKWKERKKKAESKNRKVSRAPREPYGPNHPHRPATLYNGMIAPLIPFAIQGSIWYQGESNAGRAHQYRALFPLMIADWRAAWGQGVSSFYFVLLANYRDRAAEPGEFTWPELREAQLMALSLPAVGMGSAIDIGDAADIHPTNKQEVGRRLALNALVVDYGFDIPYSGPTYREMHPEGDKIVIHFDHCNGGLKAKDSKALEGFAIAGADKKFVWATAEIKDNTVIVSSDKVSAPVAVRYGWDDNPVSSLYNGANLPASPFRTDNWPGITLNQF